MSSWFQSCRSCCAAQKDDEVVREQHIPPLGLADNDPIFESLGGDDNFYAATPRAARMASKGSVTKKKVPSTPPPSPPPPPHKKEEEEGETKKEKKVEDVKKPPPPQRKKSVKPPPPVTKLPPPPPKKMNSLKKEDVDVTEIRPRSASPPASPPLPPAPVEAPPPPATVEAPPPPPPTDKKQFPSMSAEAKDDAKRNLESIVKAFSRKVASDNGAPCVFIDPRALTGSEASVSDIDNRNKTEGSVKMDKMLKSVKLESKGDGDAGVLAIPRTNFDISEVRFLLRGNSIKINCPPLAKLADSLLEDIVVLAVAATADTASKNKELLFTTDDIGLVPILLSFPNPAEKESFFVCLKILTMSLSSDGASGIGPPPSPSSPSSSLMERLKKQQPFSGHIANELKAR